MADGKRLRDNNGCYVCGRENPQGLGVLFEVDAGAKTIRGNFTPTTVHQGFVGIVHGGILAALLDEAMAKLSFSLGIPAVTAEMTIKFKAPLSPGETISVSGTLLNDTGRLLEAEARIMRGLVVIAEAKGKLLRVKE